VGPPNPTRDAAADAFDYSRLTVDSAANVDDVASPVSGTADAGCKTGRSCGDGGVCTAGTCCAAEAACGELCCPDGQVCSFDRCVALGATCADATDCAEGEYCEYALASSPAAAPIDAGCAGGASWPAGRCLPRPPICTAADAGRNVTCFPRCEYRPSARDFKLQLEYAWKAPAGASGNIMMTPIVVQLDDDDCDGKVTERDIPDILFTTYPSGAYNGTGVLYAVSIVKGTLKEKWHVSSGVYSTKQIAGGDLDGTSGAEVVACGSDGKVRAFRSNGDPYWATAQAVECFMPSIADMDGDGHPEVVVEGGILDGRMGAVLHPLKVDGPIVVSDIDGDGKPDVVTASQAFDGDGKQRVATGLVAEGSFRDSGDWKGPWAAIGDFDLDGKPEVVAVDNAKHALSVWRYDGSSPAHFKVVREPVDINGTLDVTHCSSSSWGGKHGGGPPTVGDFNGDGVPDVAVAGGVGYAVFDGRRLVASPPVDPLLWASQTQDCSSASTGSSLFDFNGDGRAEVIYSDELYLRVYEGDTGQVLEQQCNSTGTLAENPIVADVDNDGQADIVVVANDMSKCEGGAQVGLRVFGSASGSWVRTRRVWNQHAYHITNVEEDGTIPRQELPNWTQPGLNNFRQNKQPGMEFAAPDAVVSLQPACGDPKEMVAVVRNVGQAALPAGMQVTLTALARGTATPIAAGSTAHTLYPTQAEQVTLAIPPSAASAVAVAETFSVVVDVDVRWHECRTDNNGASLPHGPCWVIP
jgi:hypothetical protein